MDARTVNVASHTALVLTADSSRFYDVFRPALAVVSIAGGPRLEPLWLDLSRPVEVASDEELDAFQRAAVVVADLEGLGPGFFALAAFMARARGGRVLLLRCGSRALPFELREHAVHPLALASPEEALRARGELSERAAMATELPTGVPGEGPAGQAARWRRRQKNGTVLQLRLAASLLLFGEKEAALGRLDAALAADGEAGDLLLQRALLMAEVRRSEDALADLERATRLAPDLAPAWRELGILRRRCGLEGAEAALSNAVDLVDDHAALVALSGLRGLAGDRTNSLRLLERASEASGGQWNLVLPCALARAALDRRVDLTAATRARLDQVRALRVEQATAEPPQDLPWSAFDAALAALVLGEGREAVALARRGREAAHASWELDPFAIALEQLAEAGVDVAPVREAAALPLPARRTATPAVADPAAARSGPGFRVAARDAAWFAVNVPCAAACPVGTDAGTYVSLAARGHDAQAYRTARAPNPFASVCGRVCAAPCEAACRRGSLDAPVTIRALKRFLTERHGAESHGFALSGVLDGSPLPGLESDGCVGRFLDPARPRGQGAPVAVVGGGPAGLACAHDLALRGYRVTVFEASERLGGMMRHGIPEHRLPRDVLDREIEDIVSLGVEVRLATGLDAGRTLGWLREQGFEAVFLGSGAGRGRDLEVEGAALDGVVRAIDFLINVHGGFRMDLGSRVVVVGGGNVAIDVARTARRGTARPASADSREAACELGPSLPTDALRRAVGGVPREVHVVARPPLGDWPAQEGRHGREELEEARREGIALHPLRGVRRVLGEGGRVVGVELAEVVRLMDDQGRYAPAYGPHPAETIGCDAVLLAVGQEPDLDYLKGTAGLRRTSRGFIEVDPATLATSQDAVFAGGDVAFGPRTLIEAVAEGKRAARSIDARLAGPRTRARVHRFETLEPRSAVVHPAYDRRERRDPPCEPLDRRTGIAEVDLGFTEEEARRQASRCLSCHVQTVFDGTLCIACGRCVDVCPHRCLTFAPLSDLSGADAPTADALARCRGPDPVALLKDEDLCIRCGLCAVRCPTGAMTMERYATSMPVGSP